MKAKKCKVNKKNKQNSAGNGNYLIEAQMFATM